MQLKRHDLTAVDFLTARDTAELFGVHEVTLAKWRVLGTGPRFYKLGGRIFYKQADLDAFVENAARRSTREAA